MRIERVVIAGAGLAGLRTAEELRARGYSGAITMIGAERLPPYDRPPLTKKFMTGQVDDTTLAADMGALGVDLRLGEAATGLSVSAVPSGGPERAVAVEAAGGAGAERAGVAGAGRSRTGEAGGRPSGPTAGTGAGILRTGLGEYAFDALVLATGATPLRLVGRGQQRILRTLDDARELRAALRPGVRLAVVGAGWIGAELATAAAARGCAVTVVEAGPAPLAGVLGAEVGSRTSSWYADAGVELLLGQPVESVEPGGLALPGGKWVAADEIVTAVGVRPDVGWLAGSGIDLADGVAVDERLRASAPGVFAVGDCAAFYSRRYRRWLRVEHWDNALHAPEVAAANVLGGDEVYDPVPYFWSEQFGRMVQYVGHHTGDDRLIWRGEPTSRGWTVCWLAGSAAGSGSPGAGPVSPAVPGTPVRPQPGEEPVASPASQGQRLVAVLAVGRPRDLLQGRRLIASGAPVNAARLADPSVPLRDAAADGVSAGW